MELECRRPARRHRALAQPRRLPANDAPTAASASNRCSARAFDLADAGPDDAAVVPPTGEVAWRLTISAHRTPEDTVMNLLDELRTHRLLAIVRGRDPAAALTAVLTLAESGVALVEVSLTSADALDVIRRARAALGPDFALGAGTVLSAEDARAAADAGAGLPGHPGHRGEPRRGRPARAAGARRRAHPHRGRRRPTRRGHRDQALPGLARRARLPRRAARPVPRYRVRAGRWCRRATVPGATWSRGASRSASVPRCSATPSDGGDTAALRERAAAFLAAVRP